MIPGIEYIGYALIVFAVLGGAGYLVSLFNSLIQVKNNVGKAWHNIDVLLIQRNEEIPKLVDVTGAYGKYEQELMGELVRLRKKYSVARRSDQKTDTENQLAAKLRQVFGVGERYPDIKADALYRNVQERISALEEMIADRRAFFNETVKIYNVQCEQFPQLIFARLMGFRPHPYLDVPQEPTR